MGMLKHDNIAWGWERATVGSNINQNLIAWLQQWLHRQPNDPEPPPPPQQPEK